MNAIELLVKGWRRTDWRDGMLTMWRAEHPAVRIGSAEVFIRDGDERALPDIADPATFRLALDVLGERVGIPTGVVPLVWARWPWAWSLSAVVNMHECVWFCAVPGSESRGSVWSGVCGVAEPWTSEESPVTALAMALADTSRVRVIREMELTHVSLNKDGSFGIGGTVKVPR